MLGDNLIRNPDCILANGQWGMGSLGPDNCIEFNGKLLIASQQSVITTPGNYKLTLTYESDGPFRAIVGDGGYKTVPASAGGVFSDDFTVTDPAHSGIAFQDRTEEAAGRILRAELRQILT